jgi:hypothetical protein
MDIKSWFPKPEAVVLGHGLVQAFAKSLPIRGFYLSMGWISPLPNAVIERRESSESVILVDCR